MHNTYLYNTTLHIMYVRICIIIYYLNYPTIQYVITSHFLMTYIRTYVQYIAIICTVHTAMYVRMYVCIYVRMYVCTYIRTYIRIQYITIIHMYTTLLYRYVCTVHCYVHMYSKLLLMYVRTYVCTVHCYVCTYVRTYVQ